MRVLIGLSIRSTSIRPAKKFWVYLTAYPHYMLSRLGLVSPAGFRDRWVCLMAWLMADWMEQRVQALCAEIVQIMLVPDLRADVVQLLQQHKEQGHHVVLVSTMFDGIVSGLAAYLGADAGLGSHVDMQNGYCSGRIVGETCSGGRKAVFAQAYFQEHDSQFTLHTCAAYADSASDIPFLASVGYPVATYPDETMHRTAITNQWQIFEGSG